MKANRKLSPKPPGRREATKLRTRRTIIEVARELASKNGLKETTVESIAKASGISLRTFHNYFSSKEEAFVAPSDPSADRLIRHLQQRPDDEPAFEALLNALKESIDPDEPEMQVLGSREIMVRQNPDLFHRYLAQVAKRDEEVAEALLPRCMDAPNPAFRARLLVSLVMTAMRAGATFWFENQDQADLRSVVVQALEDLRKGF